MRRSETLTLDDDARSAERGNGFTRHIVAIGTDDHNDIGRARADQRRDGVTQHAPAGNGVQNLGQIRIHPRALACRQHDGEA
jgi:hypothetical protein